MGAAAGGMPTPSPCIEDKTYSTESCFFQRNEITDSKIVWLPKDIVVIASCQIWK